MLPCPRLRQAFFTSYVQALSNHIDTLQSPLILSHQVLSYEYCMGNRKWVNPFLCTFPWGEQKHQQFLLFKHFVRIQEFPIEGEKSPAEISFLFRSARFKTSSRGNIYKALKHALLYFKREREISLQCPKALHMCFSDLNLLCSSYSEMSYIMQQHSHVSYANIYATSFPKYSRYKHSHLAAVHNLFRHENPYFLTFKPCPWSLHSSICTVPATLKPL